MRNEKKDPIARDRIAATPAGSNDRAESGQIMVSLLLMLSIFLLAMVGFAVDLTNLWFHRQAAQTAADAACNAGAMDMAALAAGMALPNMGFTPGMPADCTSGTGTICFYANANGYNGAGIVASSPSNSVTYSFPASVAGTTTPPSSVTAYPFLQVLVAENVKTHFLYTIHGTTYQKVAASCTCGLVQEKEAAPVVVLNPTVSSAFYYGGGGTTLNIVGGPQRALQVNSSSATAIDCQSGIINTSVGGPKGTGSDVAAVGGPAQISTTCFNGGTAGRWSGGAFPVSDPYAGVGPPVSVKSQTPISGTAGTSVQKAQSLSMAGQDGCPDTSHPCMEFSPGYYPNGIAISGNQTYIFLPGIYYLGGPLAVSGGTTLRMATPCQPSCSPLSISVGQQTDGLMFYFYSGSINISGNSGTNTTLIPVRSTSLTCDGSAPSPALNMPSTLNGNILIGQCATNGTYWDAGGDTSDSRGSPGSRGIMMYQDHGNTTFPPIFGGSGALSFSGSLYFHSSSYSDIFTLSGSSSTGTFILGEVVADQISLNGNGAVNLALNPAPSIDLLKVGMLQ